MYAWLFHLFFFFSFFVLRSSFFALRSTLSVQFLQCGISILTSILLSVVRGAQFNLHLLVDEAFANQTFPSSFVPSPPPFTSILSLSLSLQLQGKCDPSRIHVLTGPTKTFGASGIKVGALVSQANPVLVGMLNAALRATPVSSVADGLITGVLCGEMEGDLGEDSGDRNGEGKGKGSEELGTGLGGFARWFLEENRRRLSVAFELVGAWCVFHKIEYVSMLPTFIITSSVWLRFASLTLCSSSASSRPPQASSSWSISTLSCRNMDPVSMTLA